MRSFSRTILISGLALCLHNTSVSAAILQSGDVLPVPVNPSADFFVGSFGTGNFTINGGSSQTNTNGRVGDQVGSLGVANVTGSGSNWVNNAELFVGSFGTGNLTIQNGGSVSSTNGKVGDQIGSSGAVNVEGVGSSWANNAELFVGSAGTGNLVIHNGGTVLNTNGKIGDQAGSFGSVLVSGSDSSWNNSTELFVGSFGTGDLVIQDGGSVTNTNGKIGDQAGSQGSAKVTGAGSNWNNDTDLFVGQLGSASLTIDDQGTVDVTNTARVSSAGTLNLGIGKLTAHDLELDGILSIVLSDEGNGILDIANSAVLGGTLEFSFLDSFIPDVGDSFTFLQAGNVTGLFDQIIFPDLVSGGLFDFIFDSSSAWFEVTSSPDSTSVPAPMPLPLILFSFIMAVLFHKKPYRIT